MSVVLDLAVTENCVVLDLAWCAVYRLNYTVFSRFVRSKNNISLPRLDRKCHSNLVLLWYLQCSTDHKAERSEPTECRERSRSVDSPVAATLPDTWHDRVREGQRSVDCPVAATLPDTWHDRVREGQRSVDCPVAATLPDTWHDRVREGQRSVDSPVAATARHLAWQSER